MYIKVCKSESRMINEQVAESLSEIKTLLHDINSANYYAKLKYRGNDVDVVLIELKVDDIVIKDEYLLGESVDFKAFILNRYNEKTISYFKLNNFFESVRLQRMTHEYQFVVKNSIVHSYSDMHEITADDIWDIKRALCGNNLDMDALEKSMKNIKVYDVNKGKMIA